VSVLDSEFRHGMSLQFHDERLTDASPTLPVVVRDNVVADVGDPGPPVVAGISVVLWPMSGPSPVVTGNTVSGVEANPILPEGTGRALLVQSHQLIISNLAGNTGSNNASNFFDIGGVVVANGSWPTSGLPWVVTGPWASFRSGLTVPDGVALTVPAGAVAKFSRFSAGLTVASGGRLVVAGTEASPVTFTSVRDDSVGGDTNGDGAATSPAAGDWGGIGLQGSAMLDVRFLRARYGGVVGGNTLTDGGSVSVLDSEFRHGMSLQFHDERMTGASPTLPVVVRDNVVADVGHPGLMVVAGISVVLGPTSGPSPVVTGNTVSGVEANPILPEWSGRALLVRSHQLVVSNLAGNTGSNNASNFFDIGGVVVANGSWPTSGLPWVVTGSWAFSSGLTVPDGVTLTVPAGAVAKFHSAGLTVASGGRLVVAGTEASPVTFTSIRDDSVGGDTNGDGAATSPAAGDWGGISIYGTLDADQVRIRWANIGVLVGSGAVAEIHGQIVDVQAGIEAADGAFVDAREVDWGDPSGPSPFGSGSSVRGSVIIMPWVGFVAPPPPQVPPQPPTPPAPVDTACNKVFFVGVRGSGQPPQGDPDDPNWESLFSGPADGLGPEAWSAYEGFQAMANASRPDVSIFPYGLRYAAENVPFIPSPTFGQSGVGVTVREYFHSIWDGVFRLRDLLRGQSAACENQRFVLAGYSQGALVIHLALSEGLLNDESNRILGVALIADPAKTPNGGELVWTLPYITDPDMNAAWGIYAKHFTSDPLPSFSTSRAVSICHTGDLVCAPGFFTQGNLLAHLTPAYVGESRQLGMWIANHFIEEVP